MREFLIRTAADHGWPALPAERAAEVLRPAGWAVELAPGAGEPGYRIDGATISCSAEEVGWLVTIDGGPLRATDWVDRVTLQVGEAVGEPCEWIELT